MASSTPELYPKPARSTSGKSSSSLLFTLAERIERSTLPAQARNILLAQLRASNNDFGSEIFPANLGVAIEGRVSYITARRWAKRMCQEIYLCGHCGHRGWLNSRGACPKPRCQSTNVHGTGQRLLTLKHGSNWLSATGVRRPVTYQINAEAIPSAYETYNEFKRRTGKVVSFRRRNTEVKRRTHRNSSPVAQAEPQIQTGELPSPAVAPPSFERAQFKPRLPRGRKFDEFMDRVKQLERGVTRLIPPEGGMARELHPGDREYRKPEPMWAAILTACKEFGIPMEYAKEQLRYAGYKNLEIEGKP